MVSRPLPLFSLIALALGAITFAALLATAPQIGLTWDEPAYIAASESYVMWFDRLANAPRYALGPAAIQTYWDINHEHPPLNKIYSGAVWSLARHVTDDLTAHRMGNMLLASALVASLFWTVARGFGGWAGLAAAAALLSMPRFFFHAHLAALDVPAAVAVFLLTALFWHTRERRGVWWDVLFGVAWGVAMAVKVNALLVPPTILIWLLVVRGGWRLARRAALALPIGALVFVALWPWLYHDTLERLVRYALFITVDHWDIGQWYLHAWHMPPPWHFAPVMLVAATPTALLALAALGAALGAYGRFADHGPMTEDQSRTFGAAEPTADGERPLGPDAAPNLAASTLALGRSSSVGGRQPALGPSSLALLWALSAAAPLGALMIGQTKVYDNERLFMPVFPFVAALAGVGLVWAVSSGVGLLRRRSVPWLARQAVATLAVLLVPASYAPQVASGAALYPHLLSYYSDAVGGLPGAVALGLESTYWCETYAEMLPFINERAPRGATVWAEPWSHDVLLYYQSVGRLRADLRVVMTSGAGTILASRGAEGVEGTIATSDYVIVAYRETGLAVNPEMRAWMEGREPLVRVRRFGVPLVDLYEAAAGS